MRFFLKKTMVLRSTVDIEHLFKSTTVFRGIYFDIFYRQASESKVLFAVSKQVRGHVNKNRMKRLLREMYRLKQHDLKGHQHLAIIIKRSTKQVSLKDLCKEFQVFIQHNTS